MTYAERLAAAERTLRAADRALSRFAIKCARQDSDRSPKQEARNAAREAELIKALAAAERDVHIVRTSAR